MKKWFENFWYYYKVPVIIVLIVLAVGIYFYLQKDPFPGDYDIGIVSAVRCSDDQLMKIKAVVADSGVDLNGDGVVSVKDHVFLFAFGADEQGSNEAARLDADLVGNVSGIFITDDPEGFERTTNGIVRAAEAIPLGNIHGFSGIGLDNMYIFVRRDAHQKYTDLIAELTDPL